MLNCMFIPLRREGIDTLNELCTLAEVELESGQIIRIGNVLATFPSEMLEVVAAFDENIHDDTECLTHVFNGHDQWIDLHKITTKELQAVLKQSLNKIESQDFVNKIWGKNCKLFNAN